MRSFPAARMQHSSTPSAIRDRRTAACSLHKEVCEPHKQKPQEHSHRVNYASRRHIIFTYHSRRDDPRNWCLNACGRELHDVLFRTNEGKMQATLSTAEPRARTPSGKSTFNTDSSPPQNALFAAQTLCIYAVYSDVSLATCAPNHFALGRNNATKVFT